MIYLYGRSVSHVPEDMHACQEIPTRARRYIFVQENIDAPRRYTCVPEDICECRRGYVYGYMYIYTNACRRIYIDSIYYTIYIYSRVQEGVDACKTAHHMQESIYACRETDVPPQRGGNIEGPCALLRGLRR